MRLEVLRTGWGVGWPSVNAMGAGLREGTSSDRGVTQIDRWSKGAGNY